MMGGVGVRRVVGMSMVYDGQRDGGRVGYVDGAGGEWVTGSGAMRDYGMTGDGYV